MKIYFIVSFDPIKQYNHCVVTASEWYADYELRRMLKDHTGKTPIPTDTTPDDLIEWYDTHFEGADGQIGYHVFDTTKDADFSIFMFGDETVAPQSIIDRLEEQREGEEIARAARDLETMEAAGHA